MKRLTLLGQTVAECSTTVTLLPDKLVLTFCVLLMSSSPMTRVVRPESPSAKEIPRTRL